MNDITRRARSIACDMDDKAVVEQLISEVERLQAELAALKSQEPVAYQYQDKEGNWKPFINSKHYEDTKADGSWPIRALYLHPTPTDRDAERLDWLADKCLTRPHGLWQWTFFSNTPHIRDAIDKAMAVAMQDGK